MTLVIDIMDKDLTLGLGLLDTVKVEVGLDEIIIDKTEELNIVNELVNSSYETFLCNLNGFGLTTEVPCGLLN